MCKPIDRVFVSPKISVPNGGILLIATGVAHGYEPITISFLAHGFNLFHLVAASLAEVIRKRRMGHNINTHGCTFSTGAVALVEFMLLKSMCKPIDRVFVSPKISVPNGGILLIATGVARGYKDIIV